MANELVRFDLDEIRQAIRILFVDVKLGAGECIEVRMPDKKKQATACGWFDDENLLAKAVGRLAREGYKENYRHIHDNVYWTINPVADALLSRQAKNTISLAGDTTSDNNITRRLWLPVDIDPLRPSGVSATDDEKRLAREVANALMEKLAGLGFPESCMVGGTSGNGYHVLIRVDLPNDNESRDLVKACLAAMQELVGTDKVEIDPKVFNASRILKSYGTLSCKGVNSETRPWRVSRLTVLPEIVTIADRALLQNLALLAPDEKARRGLGAKRKGPWNETNTQEYVDWTGWDCSGSPPKWIGTCINDQNHKDAALILHPDGWWSWSCFHASCAQVRHHQFREYWEREKGEKFPTPGLRTAEVSGSVTPQEFRAIREMYESNANRKQQAFNLTDAGNMERLVLRYGHGFRYCPQRDWYWWDGTRWVADDVGRISRAALDTVRHIPDEIPLHWEEDEAIVKWAKASESRSHLSAMEELAKSAAGIAADISEFDRDPWLFNCQNGTIDLRSGEFCEHRQTDMITKISTVAYDAKADCPLWKSFLSDIMLGSEENIAFLQRAIGYSLTGSTSEHCLFILWGAGRNGKSTFLELLRYLAGSYSKTASMDMFLEKTHEGIPNDLAALQGARFVSAAETKDGRHLDEPKIKQITGGDTVTARFLHREWFEFKPEFKIWLATNHRPVIRGTDEGIWRRIRLVPFTLFIPDGKKDERLLEKLISEASGILNWALSGTESFRKEGLMEPKDVLAATDEYRAEEDWLARFLDAEIERASNGRVQAKHMYERYKSWAERCKERVQTERKFNDYLKSRGTESRKLDGRKYYVGLSLRGVDTTDRENMDVCLADSL